MRYRPATRLQDVSAVAWACLCLLLVYQSSRQLTPQHAQLLWTYFQPLGPVLAMLALYAQAVGSMDVRHIAHADCFPEQQRRLLAPARDLLSMAQAFTCLCATCLAVAAMLSASTRPAASHAAALAVPPLMYGACLALLLAPVGVLRRPSRRFFCRTLGRVLLPTRPVSWADFLLADVMTSLAKSCSDLVRSVCLMLHGQLAHPGRPEASAAATAACGPLTLLSLAALVLPYGLRLVQCLSVWRAGGPSSQLFNALKYASSLPALMLTQMEHEHHVHKLRFPLRRMWLVVMVVNSAYSFYWDVEQDWDMPWLVQYGGRRVFGWLLLPGLKGSHLYSRAWYGWLLASNLVLRFSWAHRLLGDLEAHSSVLMAVALLEVVRRWQWLFVRVETELRRQGALQLLPTDSEDDLTGRSSDEGGGGASGGGRQKRGPAAAVPAVLHAGAAMGAPTQWHWRGNAHAPQPLGGGAGGSGGDDGGGGDPAVAAL